MARMEKDGTKIYQTEDRQYKVKEQLLNTMFDCIHGFKEIIVSADKSDPYSDPRFDALTLYLTTFTLSEEACFALISERDKMIDETVDPTWDKERRNKAIYMVNIKIIARCQSSFDNYYGIKKRQEIMRIESPAIKKAKEEYGGEALLGKMFARGNETMEVVADE